MIANYLKNPKLSSLVFMDIETQSTQDLKKVGGLYYARHPDTRIMTGVFLKGNVCTVWVNKQSAPEDLHEIKLEPVTGFGFDDYTIKLVISDNPPTYPKTNTFVAHNAEQFDSVVWVEKTNDKNRTWFDSINPVRYAGLQAGIDSLGNTFFNHGKDELGKKAMLLLCKAKEKKGQVLYPIGTVALWEKMLRYNIVDVLIMRHAYLYTLDYRENEVMQVHTEINHRGIEVDTKLLNYLYDLWDEVEASAHKRISELTNGTINSSNIKSSHAVKKWLCDKGLMLWKLEGSIAKSKMELFYAQPEDFLEDGSDDDDTIAEIVNVLQLRSMANRTSKAKLARMMLSIKNNRLCHSAVYYGSHTGRSSGKGVQPYNLPKGVSELKMHEVFTLYNKGKLDLATIRKIATRISVEHKTDCREDDVLTTIMRPVFCAKKDHTLGIIDYAAIECRVLAWLASETWLLQEFNKVKADPYLAMASDIYGRPITKENKDERQVGKITVLGAGYQMGSAKFKVFCESTKPRVDLVKAGTSAEVCINTYRKKHPNIVKQWKHYELAAIEALKGRIITTGRCTFYMKNGCLIIELPSKRKLTYRGAHLTREIPTWAIARGLQVSAKDTIKYRHTFGYEKSLYGGLITENITQAVANDLLRDSKVQCREDEINVVLDVHDEIVIESPDDEIQDDMNRLALIMSTSPEWCKDLPILVEGHANKRYVKSPFPDDFRIHAHKGTVLL